VWQARTIVCVGFSRAELESFAGATVPDLIGPDVKLLFVGINPGLWTAATRTHFAHPGNRFYPALLEAGIIDTPVDRGVGMTDDDRSALTDHGIGITNVVRRATAKASELTADELRAGGEQLRAFVRAQRPVVVAIAGITAYRTAFSRPKAAMGEQPELLEGARLFVVPNPSGLNAHETTASLAAAYRQAAQAAGIVC
jgi:double-stranded uracil-DNA glycosylase